MSNVGADGSDGLVSSARPGNLRPHRPPAPSDRPPRARRATARALACCSAAGARCRSASRGCQAVSAVLPGRAETLRAAAAAVPRARLRACKLPFHDAHRPRIAVLIAAHGGTRERSRETPIPARDRGTVSGFSERPGPRTRCSAYVSGVTETRRRLSRRRATGSIHPRRTPSPNASPSRRQATRRETPSESPVGALHPTTANVLPSGVTSN